MQAMKGATVALGSMNRSMNLPQLQRIAMEFERENDIMDQRQEMMDDAIDDAMDAGVEEEGDEVVEQVLEEIGVDLSQSVSTAFTPFVPSTVFNSLKDPSVRRNSCWPPNIDCCRGQGSTSTSRRRWRRRRSGRR